MKYVLTIVSAALLSSCSLIPFLGGKMSADAAEQGIRAAIEVAPTQEK